MKDDLRLHAINSIKELILHNLNRVNAVRSLCETGKLTDGLSSEDLSNGKYKLSGTMNLEFNEEFDSFNSRNILRNIKYTLSSQIKDKQGKVIHNNSRKVICGTTNDIILTMKNENDQGETINISKFSLNSDFRIVEI